MEKKKSRCMALDCCCYFIPASALLFGFYQQVGCCWGENRFFDRDDAQIIPQYENLAKACAERHLMVDFHGCSKPTGLHRAYPNILSYEAMRCAECFKWDTTSNPDYQLQCIFARMLGGGIDYTPGSMRNSTLENLSRSIRGCLVHWGLVHMNWPCLLYFPHHLPVYVILRMSIVSILIF